MAKCNAPIFISCLPMASSLSPCLVLFFALLLVPPSAAKPRKASPLHGLVLPVTKDQSTKYIQYITKIYQRTPLVPVNLALDLGGENFWVDCIRKPYVSSSYEAAHCGSKVCKTFGDGECRDDRFCYNGTGTPGCNDKVCSANVGNRFTDRLTWAELAQDVFAVQSSNGSKPGPFVKVQGLVFPCADAVYYLLGDFSDSVDGMAGFGRGKKLGFPSLLSSAFRLPNKFAICLSSARSTGVIFFGNKPYLMHPERDISPYLLYTPLLVNPYRIPGYLRENDQSTDYWIQVKSIKISGKTVPINTTVLTIDKEGYGGTKISTIHPYTVMKPSIYKPFIEAFVKELAHIPRVKSVEPFGVCYSAKNLPNTQVGPSAPFIDLVLHSESVWWRIYGANSLVRVRKDVLCLGFVDGGERLEAGMVIGAHQIEDNLLQFDLENSRLGFTSSLLLQQTACSKFNFKAKA